MNQVTGGGDEPTNDDDARDPANTDELVAVQVDQAGQETDDGQEAQQHMYDEICAHRSMWSRTRSNNINVKDDSAVT